MKCENLIGTVIVCAATWIFTYQAIGVLFCVYLLIHPLPEFYEFDEIPALPSTLPLQLKLASPCFALPSSRLSTLVTRLI
jgi:hypothetical protein